MTLMTPTMPMIPQPPTTPAGTGDGRAGAAADARREWVMALVLTAVVAALSVVRMLHAGGLWRDEAGAARLAALPTLREIAGLFQHEAFPPLFAVTVRAYSHMAGSGDQALRVFGLAVGLTIAGILWLNARTTARTVPLLSLALLGLDLPFLIFGESVRGYGMGSALILLTYGLLARAVAWQPEGHSLDGSLPERQAPRMARGPGEIGKTEPPLSARPAPLAGRRWPAGLLGLAAVAAVASVQVLVSNAALVLALCTAAAAVAVARRRWLVAGGIVGCGAVAALSLLPYAAQLAAARRQWSVIVTYSIGARQVWRAFIATVGPRPVLAAWLLLALAGLAGLARELTRRRGRQGLTARPLPVPAAAPGERPEEPSPVRSEAERESAWTGAAAFAGLTLVCAVVANAIFLERLGYPPRPWYFLPLMALMGSALDTLFGVLARRRGGSFAALRAAAVVLVAAAQTVPMWQHLTTRQTNADLVAREVAQSAAPQDLVVVLPWFYGVSFNRYYTGPARWLTLPDIADHRIHRYDLLKPRLASPHPLDDVLEEVAATLRSGHRVWVAGNTAWTRIGGQATMPPPAPFSPAGWHDYPYMVSWSRSFGRFLARHASLIATVAVPAHRQPVSNLEDLQLEVAEGWH
jgi:hypothetical protein